MAQLKKRQTAFEHALSDLQQSNTALSQQNRVLWQDLRASEQRQQQMQAKMQKVLYILFQMYRGVANGRLGASVQPMLAHMMTNNSIMPVPDVVGSDDMSQALTVSQHTDTATAASMRTNLDFLNFDTSLFTSPNSFPHSSTIADDVEPLDLATPQGLTAAQDASSAGMTPAKRTIDEVHASNSALFTPVAPETAEPESLRIAIPSTNAATVTRSKRSRSNGKLNPNASTACALEAVDSTDDISVVPTLPAQSHVQSTQTNTSTVVDDGLHDIGGGIPGLEAVTTGLAEDENNLIARIDSAAHELQGISESGNIEEWDSILGSVSPFFAASSPRT